MVTIMHNIVQGKIVMIASPKEGCLHSIPVSDPLYISESIYLVESFSQSFLRTFPLSLARMSTLPTFLEATLCDTSSHPHIIHFFSQHGTCKLAPMRAG